MNIGIHYGMRQANIDKQFQSNKQFIEDETERTSHIHEDVRRRWQAESDAVKLREMEKNNGDS